MNDRNLKIISLSFAIIGILGLAIISLQNEYTSIKVYEISESMIGKKVIVNGTVTSFTAKDSNQFITIEDLGSMMVFAPNSKIFIKNGMNITVYGKVNVYKNELEIVAEKIISLPTS